jgi:hypothetical protein
MMQEYFILIISKMYNQLKQMLYQAGTRGDNQLYHQEAIW